MDKFIPLHHQFLGLPALQRWQVEEYNLFGYMPGRKNLILANKCWYKRSPKSVIPYVGIGNEALKSGDVAKNMTLMALHTVSDMWEEQWQVDRILEGQGVSCPLWSGGKDNTYIQYIVIFTRGVINANVKDWFQWSEGINHVGQMVIKKFFLSKTSLFFKGEISHEDVAFWKKFSTLKVFCIFSFVLSPFAWASMAGS